MLVQCRQQEQSVQGRPTVDNSLFTEVVQSGGVEVGTHAHVRGPHCQCKLFVHKPAEKGKTVWGSHGLQTHACLPQGACSMLACAYVSTNNILYTAEMREFSLKAHECYI